MNAVTTVSADSPLDSSSAPGGDGCLHWLFEEQAARRPEAVAVEAEGVALSYRELDARANRLAHLLRRRGVRPGALVGLWGERSLEMLVSLLATLKAGGAYVPLGTDWPLDRVRQVIEDTHLLLLVAGTDEAARVPDLADRLFTLGPVEGPSTRPESEATPRDLCYVLYTSGSTGRPKGVQIEHRSAAHLVRVEQQLFDIQPTDRIYQAAALTFDASLEELGLAWWAGATLVLPRRDTPAAGPGLEQALIEHRITVHSSVPSLLATMRGPIPSLRLLLLGGEECPPELVQRWARPGLRIVNAYGPTEATVIATCGELSPERPVTIGRPLPGYSAHVLDNDMRPLPPGESGELYLGGIGLARGYLNQPELTREKFVPSPFNPGERLYRTGDRCRLTPEGEIEYLGRVDWQVKLRGLRIELGEIESALRERVRDAVVVLREDVPGNKRLVAYYVPHEAPPGPALLRRYLRDRLPEYMVPSAFIALPALPLAPNGKLDRDALPAPFPPPPAPSPPAPRDEVEQALLTIWARVLGAQGVGVEDNFFDLGGHSLLAIQLFAEVERAFGRRLSLATLFRAPTIRHLARVIQQAEGPEALDWVLPIQPRGTRRPLFLLHSLTGDLLHWRDLTSLLGDDQPCYGLHPRRRGGELEPFVCFEDMAARYIEALRQLQPTGPYQLAGSSFGGEVAYEMARQLTEQGERVALLAIFDTDLSRHQPRRWWRWLMALGVSLLNLPWWVRYDLLATGPGPALRRAGRKVHSIAWRVGKKLGLADPTGPDPDDRWDESVTAEYQKIFTRYDAAWEAYRPRAFPGRAFLFRARARALFHWASGPDLGWGRLARGGVDVETFPGTHDSILRQPLVGSVARRLRSLLAERG